MIASVGLHIPKTILKNQDLERIVQGTSNDWIVSRTGINERRVAPVNETNIELAYKAAAHALEQLPQGHNIQISRIILATNTNPCDIPARCPLVYKHLKENYPAYFATGVGTSDSFAGCSGLNVALADASARIKAEFDHDVLVIGAEKLSSMVDVLNRETAVLFGDAAAAMVLTRNSIDTLSGFIGHDGITIPELSDYIRADLAPMVPLDEAVAHYDFDARQLRTMPFPRESRTVRMAGREVYKFVLDNLKILLTEFEGNARLNPNQLPYTRLKAIVPHGANRRMFEAVDEKCPGFLEKCALTIDTRGNTSAASQGEPFYRLLEQGSLSPGDHVLFVGFGSGLSLAANLYRMPEKYRIPVLGCDIPIREIEVKA